MYRKFRVLCFNILSNVAQEMELKLETCKNKAFPHQPSACKTGFASCLKAFQ